MRPQGFGAIGAGLALPLVAPAVHAARHAISYPIPKARFIERKC
jgi:hypothetical protein